MIRFFLTSQITLSCVAGVAICTTPCTQLIDHFQKEYQAHNFHFGSTTTPSFTFSNSHFFSGQSWHASSSWRVLYPWLGAKRLMAVSLLVLNRLQKVPVDSFGSDTWPCGVVSIFGCLDPGIFGWEACDRMQIPDSCIDGRLYTFADTSCFLLLPRIGVLSSRDNRHKPFALRHPWRTGLPNNCNQNVFFLCTVTPSPRGWKIVV